MKYIRTKDGIFEYIELEDKLFIKRNNLVAPILNKNDLEKDIIKIANTIEELCDEFVIEFEEKHHIVFDKNKLLKSVIDIQKMLLGGAIILGAVWTDKGLIYVAKMNDKGELELL